MPERVPVTGGLGPALAALLRLPVAVVSNGVRFGPGRCLATLAAVVRLFFRLCARGARAGPALRFLRSRHFRSQVMLPRRPGLVFLTSIPYTYGQAPWVIEVEDATSLFYPFLLNGQTHAVDVASSPFFPVVKALLESENCRGIVTHMRSTARALPTLFGSEAVGRKTFYVPLGVRPPPRGRRHDGAGDLHLLFSNSWHQNPQGFFVRGGLDVLEAFAILRGRFPRLRLTLRCRLPDLPGRYHRIIERGWVRVIDRFLPAGDWDALRRQAHVCLLPAARIHVVSALGAMAYGQAVVVSDGWGFDEYVTHGRNGLVVTGRAGKVSWMDGRAGLLREDYRPMYAPDPQVVEGLVGAVSRLAEDPALRACLGRQARADVETKYNLERWNKGLKAALDRARAAPGDDSCSYPASASVTTSRA
jgi:glycosyltransferase involved in cell wall biosynthesis